MKVLTLKIGNEYVPALSRDGINAVTLKSLGLDFATTTELIRSGYDVTSAELSGKPAQKIGEDCSLAAPIVCPEHDVICLGINYAAHAEESARYKKEAFERERAYPVYFGKRVLKATADGEDVSLHTDVTERVDYEAELAFVISKDACGVKAKDAFDYVYGYTVINDVSARDVQTRHKQWYFGKSLDGFTPMGPWIVTADCVDPRDLYVRSYVNGELRQDGNTSLLMFGIPHIIEELSAGMTLAAGTVISTGTPAGVGMGFDPPKFLKNGDVVRCEVEGIGSITNRFVK